MTVPSFPDLRSDRLIVRPARLGDEQAIVAYRALADVAAFQSWTNFDEADATKMLAAQAARAPDTPGTWFQLVIEECASGDILGDLALHHLAHDPRQVELGINLAPDCQGRGYGREASSLVLDDLFGRLARHRVIAITDARNEPAARLFLSAGFRQEAHFIDHVWFKGAYGSEYLFAMLSRDWIGKLPPPPG